MSRLCLVATLVLLVPASAIAGPNAGGTLILHANPSLVLSDGMDYCGQSGLTACDSAVVTLPADPGVPKLFWATAAFPDSSSPRMSVITFGINYDPNKFAIIEQHPCGDSQLPMDSWPDPGSGTAVQWNTAQTDRLRDVYWMRGYLYAPSGPDSTLVELTAHPTQAGVFADDASPAAVDTIAGYGKLGFGMPGVRPCPAAPLGSGSHGIHISGGGEPEEPREPPAAPFTAELDLAGADFDLWVAGTHIVTPPLTVTYDGGDSVFVSGVVVRLATPHAHLPSDSGLLSIYGRAPRIAALMSVGATFHDAAMEYRAEIQALDDSVRSIGPRRGIDGVIQFLRGSALIDSVFGGTGDRQGGSVTVSYAGVVGRIDIVYTHSYTRSRQGVLRPKPSVVMAHDLTESLTLALREARLESASTTFCVGSHGAEYTSFGAGALQLRQQLQYVLNNRTVVGLPPGPMGDAFFGFKEIIARAGN